MPPAVEVRNVGLMVPPQPPTPTLRYVCVQVKLDVYLAELTKIGKSQKFTLSVDVEGGRLVVMKKAKDSQEDWTTYTHDKSMELLILMSFNEQPILIGETK